MRSSPFRATRIIILKSISVEVLTNAIEAPADRTCYDTNCLRSRAPHTPSLIDLLFILITNCLTPASYQSQETREKNGIMESEGCRKSNPEIRERKKKLTFNDSRTTAFGAHYVDNELFLSQK